MLSYNSRVQISRINNMSYLYLAVKSCLKIKDKLAIRIYVKIKLAILKMSGSSG